MPKSLHKPIHRTIIVQFCPPKSMACERKSIRPDSLGVSASFNVEGTFVVLGFCSHGPFRDENISGKFEPSAQFSHLFYGEISLPGQEH